MPLDLRALTVSGLQSAFVDAGYLTGDELATSLFLALSMKKPLLLEGAPGVGKTEAARTLATVLGRELVRLQCYEGISTQQALYEWNYPRQLLALRRPGKAANLYSDEFLDERPLLTVLKSPDRYVLLIDEIDRADHEFEAFLLEFLSDFQISIPEIGTLKANVPPPVILTSNRTRALHEALRRRCLYHWIDYPDATREAEIIRLRVPEAAPEASRAVARAVLSLRQRKVSKAPGISEAIDWARAASLLRGEQGDWPLAFRKTIGAVLKDGDDLAYLRDDLDHFLADVCAE
ncbi:MoxR family ATPase [Mesorhizobium australicum]|uniref:AAA family ATPase n=1 Tax=Mesorhizobium australicum TaxID=536018 RepID=UPI0033363698